VASLVVLSSIEREREREIRREAEQISAFGVDPRTTQVIEKQSISLPTTESDRSSTDISNIV
jgi:hypothetical protein